MPDNPFGILWYLRSRSLLLLMRQISIVFDLSQLRFISYQFGFMLIRL